MRKVLKLPLVPGLAVVAVAVTGTALAVGTASAETGGASDTALVATLDQVLANSRLAGSTTGLQVRDATSGAVIYSHNAEQRVIPASNEKLMTSAAALEVLGTGYKFHTYARYSGTKSGKTVSGNLYLKGQGDPTLTYAQFDAIATAVNRAGITKFTGSLVADDTWFDRTPLGLDWSWQDETYADTAPISALTVAADGNFNSGAVAVVTKPGSAANKAGPSRSRRPTRSSRSSTTRSPARRARPTPSPRPARTARTPSPCPAPCRSAGPRRPAWCRC
ncbi:hypothetical protein Asp14428_03330 [Actinoplanes sp. NBRC 14428]|nr:hypothetical protein Asp14428_03330 [Actinoplanes sp. NBRC 14428]